MTIGQLAERAGVNAKTLRYYEELGLLDSGRTPAGWRDYDDTALLVLQLTAVGKRLGLSLADIVHFVELFRDPTISNETLAEEVKPHRERLDREIQDLKRARTLLDSLVTDCPLRRC